MSNFPRTADDITSAWLTEVLRARGEIREVAVESFEMVNVGDDSGVAGDVQRLDLKYDGPVDSAPASMIAKLPRKDMPTNAVISEMSGREILFYNHLAPESGVKTPQLFFTEFDDSTGQFILLLEDLGDLRVVDQAEGCNYEDARTALRSIATMHTKWWDNSSLMAKSWLLDRLIPTGIDVAQSRFVSGFDQFLELAGDDLPDGIDVICRKLGPAIPEVITSAVGPPFTLVHGDLSLSNIFFSSSDQERNEIVAFDWQLVGRAKAACDVGLFLMQSLTTRDRRDYEDRLLAEYHSFLVERGVRNYSYAELWTDVRMGVLPRMVTGVNVMLGVGARMLESESGRHRVRSMWERLQTIVDWNCAEVIPK